MTAGVRVTELHTYPIKSCAGISLQESAVGSRGLLYDREFMLVDRDNRFLSQREIPAMALIGTSLREGALRVTAAGMPDLEIPLEPGPGAGERVQATVHGTPVTGELVGESYDDWFSSHLPPHKGTERYRLLRVVESSAPQVETLYRRAGAANELGFADAQPILLASQRSLAELNLHMESPVPMNRFRPNIVVDGPALEPYEEDHWRELRLGDMMAFVTKACDRCAIPDVDQATGETGKAVRRALVSRKGVNALDDSNTGVFFAQNLNHVCVPGISLRVGDPVDVLLRAEQPNVIIRAGAPAAR